MIVWFFYETNIFVITSLFFFLLFMATQFLFQASLQGDSLLLVPGTGGEPWKHIQHMQHNVHAGCICYTGQKPVLCL